MTTITQGFLLGVGIWTATLCYATVCSLLFFGAIAIAKLFIFIKGKIK